MMRPRLLRDFGWHVTQVLAKDWYTDPHGQLQRLLDLLAGADDPWLRATHDQLNDQDEADPEDETEETGDARHLSGKPMTEKAKEDRQTVAEALGTDKPGASEQLAVLDRRYLELRNGRSEKFWEITLGENCHTVRFGRIGSRGQSLTKQFADQDTASGDFARLLREKISKGYQG